MDVIVYRNAPMITPVANINRQFLDSMYFFWRKYGTFEKYERVVSKKLLWVACRPVRM